MNNMNKGTVDCYSLFYSEFSPLSTFILKELDF